MPHVDDGTLHALLDGALRAESPGRASEVEAHLAACADCRARLEAAEELRGEASGILDTASAGVPAAIPDFRDVVRRADAPAPDRVPPVHSRRRRAAPLGRQARWTRGVAWAASLVLALGTGYLIRDLAGPAAEDVRSPAVVTETLESAPAAPGPAADEAADPGASVGGDGESQVDRPPATPTDAGPTDAGPTEQARPATPTTPSPERRGEADAAARAAAAGEPDPGAAVARAPAPEAERMAEDLVDISPTSLRQAATRWSAVTVDEARAALDGPLYLLPRAELLDVYKLADAPAERVLSVQRLQTGVQVQVLQWRGEDEEPGVAAVEMEPAAAAGRGAPAGAGPLPYAALPDANIVRVVRDEFVLELTGSLPAALLSVLGETAGPAP